METGEVPQGPWTLFNEPRPLPLEQSFAHRIRLEFVTKGERMLDREEGLTEDLYQHYIEGQPYKQAMQAALNLFVNMREIHAPLEKAGGKAAKPRDHAVMSGMQTNIIDRVVSQHIREIPADFSEQLKDQLSAIEGSREWKHQWFIAKFHKLILATNSWRWHDNWMQGLKGKIGNAEMGEEREIRREADEIWSRVKEERRYGIKSSYFPSPLFLDRPKVFYITDPPEEEKDVKEVKFMQPAFAYLVMLGERPTEIPQFGIIEDRYVGGIGAIFNTLSGVGDAANFENSVTISDEGELKSTIESYSSLRNTFGQLGYGKEYEMFRLFLIMRLRDLTCASEVSDQLPSINEFETEVAKGEGGVLGVGKKIKKIDYKTLSVPRKKSEEELTAGTKTEEKEEKRFVDMHHVTWFVRRLPKDYSPSVQAIGYALEHGITLNSNETIVREHYRGKKRPEGQEDTRPTKAVFGKKRK